MVEFDELSGKVIAAAMEVHKQLGPGFLEALYEQALKIELSRQGLAFETQKKIEIRYCGQLIGVHMLDLVVEQALVLELKAVKELEDIHRAQLRSYLKATGIKVGLLINFNAPTLAIKRIVN